jgi:hypothetical protein
VAVGMSDWVALCLHEQLLHAHGHGRLLHGGGLRCRWAVRLGYLWSIHIVVEHASVEDMQLEMNDFAIWSPHTDARYPE